MIELFDFVKLTFTASEDAWKEIRQIDKSRNFFMMNRFMSIKYPVQVSFLSHLKIDASSALDYWHKNMRTLHSSVPSWVYAKTKKKSVEDKKKNLPSEMMIKWYCQHEELSRREYEDQVKFFGESFIKQIRELEKTLKSQGILKNIE